MKIYILFFITYSLLHLLFTGCYFMLVREIDLTIIMGTVIYLVGMLRGYRAYRFYQYREKKKALLDSLPS